MAARSRYKLWATGALVLLLSAVLSGQQSSWTVRLGGGLGVGLGNFPAMADYVNIVGRPASADRMQDFMTVAELQLTGALRLSEKWAIGLDYGYLAKQVESAPASPGSGWEFTASLRMPTLLVRRIFSDQGVLLEAAGGLGYYSGTFTERYAAYGSQNTYEGEGLGLLFEASALTPFDEHFYGTVRASLRWSFVRPLTDASGRSPASGSTTADLRFFEPGLALGLAYQL